MKNKLYHWGRIILGLVILVPSFALAHKVGNSKWCLMTTQVHLECIYDDSVACQDALNILKQFMKMPTVDKNPKTTGTMAKGEAIDQKFDPICIPNPDKPAESSTDDPGSRHKNEFNRDGM